MEDAEDADKYQRPSADEFVQQFGFDFPLTEVRLDASQSSPERSFRDVTSALKHLEFLPILGHAQEVEQRCKSLVTVQWIAGLAVLDEADIAGFHDHARAQAEFKHTPPQRKFRFQ